ncbi:BREX-6 system BrxE protein [Haliangium ochraceum]|uniref:BREX-6 system BrxE protein n=1 Tax=Haliangium ochraceum (strain DSM 14365 / JCM 11303 / SMP-2) TaxID=502025 RepID=D0LT98_HALO1|nr:BREX-6 system BrxE protein [Haliangium ochraceum]ACY13793.1 conserved hypothetical protein [Haliangium ochraceum DSM 14365]
MTTPDTPDTTERPRAYADSDIDRILSAQLVVAWAGEAGEERRLGWWRTDLVAEFGGHDLFQRLLPHTWDWAALEGVREAARRRDAELRARASDPDAIVSLFHLSFTLDERTGDRLRAFKRAGIAPNLALPALDGLIAEHWDADAFRDWAASQSTAAHSAAPTGRLLKGAPPDDIDALVGSLVAALVPLSENYPLPHYRSPR